MKVVVLTKSGRAWTLRLAPWALCAALGLAVSVIAATAAQLHERYSQHRQTTQALADWRAGIIDQQAAVTRLQRQQAAENAAISKQLANMQGRLWRMEALGQWVAEATDLDAREFDFTAPPAQGGPEREAPSACALMDGSQTQPPPAQCQDALLPRTDLQARLHELAAQIRQREGEFELFEALLKAPADAAGQTASVRPVKWGWVSSPYGRRIDPISGKMAWHTGVDFAGRRGSDVVAVDRGIVVFAGHRSGYGYMVELAHLDGHVTRYGHQGSLAVSRGDIVRQGQVIGSMGATGRSTGPHVHFEVLRNGRHLSPLKYLKDRRG